MRLEDWLNSHGIQKQDFARRLGVSNATVTHWLAGKSLGRGNVETIFAATNGAVTPNDLFGLGPDDSGDTFHLQPLSMQCIPAGADGDLVAGLGAHFLDLSGKAMRGGFDVGEASAALVHVFTMTRVPGGGNAKDLKTIAAAVQQAEPAPIAEAAA